MTTSRVPQLQAKIPGDVATEALSPTAEYSRWVSHAILLNLIICLALAGETWLQYGVPSAGTFLLAVWPAILIGPLLATIFRRIRFASLSWGLFWGTFFGLTNGLLSALVCLVWVVLVQLVADFRCPPWCASGEGLTVALNELTRIAPYAILPFVAGLWMSVIGGALIGIFNLPPYSLPERSSRRSPLASWFSRYLLTACLSEAGTAKSVGKLVFNLPPYSLPER